MSFHCPIWTQSDSLKAVGLASTILYYNKTRYCLEHIFLDLKKSSHRCCLTNFPLPAKFVGSKPTNCLLHEGFFLEMFMHMLTQLILNWHIVLTTYNYILISGLQVTSGNPDNIKIKQTQMLSRVSLSITSGDLWTASKVHRETLKLNINQQFEILF